MNYIFHFFIDVLACHWTIFNQVTTAKTFLSIFDVKFQNTAEYVRPLKLHIGFHKAITFHAIEATCFASLEILLNILIFVMGV